jgi:hypothetical protein
MVGVDAKTGQFLWRYAEVAKGPAQYFTPVARDGYVYGGALGVGGGLVRLKLASKLDGGSRRGAGPFARGLRTASEEQWYWRILYGKVGKVSRG